MPYVSLDERIIEAVREGQSSETRIRNRLNAGLSPRDPNYISESLLSRRLQAMQRRKRLVFTGSVTRSAWKLPEEG